jgi:hypothetical protein
MSRTATSNLRAAIGKGAVAATHAALVFTARLA